MEIRKLEPAEIPAAVSLIWETFLVFDAPDFAPEGVAAFRAFLDDAAGLRALKFFGAFADGELRGVLAADGGLGHICCFFVSAPWQRQGIGRRLWEHLRAASPAACITVHASPYAVPVYRALGFAPSGGRRMEDGMPYTPMTCALRPSACGAATHKKQEAYTMQTGFMTEEFLLDTETARRLYHTYAEQLPIIDYHCHVSPREIWEDRHFSNIAEAWLEADHYKWRAMRSNGVPEEKVTGAASPREKFDAYAAMMPKCIGNPLYHWTHLELKRYFGFSGCLSEKTADEVWQLCEERLRQPDMGVRGLIRRSGVEVICTTDDPADTLEYHEKLAADQSFATKVLPAWRPDKVIHLDAPGFADYMEALGKAAGMEIADFSSLLEALRGRMDYFARRGCVASDHSLGYAFFRPAGLAAAEAAFQKALEGKALTPEEREGYQTELLLFLGREYGRRGWVMQLHLGPVRNASSRMFRSFGPDAGCDCMGPALDSRPLAAFLDALDKELLLPKTILYSLNPNDNALLGSLIGCFQHSDEAHPALPGKIQQGSAWWFNDSLEGMREQMRTLASTSLLGNFVGMLTDSRSFLSYTRHEYFRRILCGLLGRFVEEGLYPADEEALGRIAADVSYYNAKRYFGF